MMTRILGVFLMIFSTLTISMGAWAQKNCRSALTADTALFKKVNAKQAEQLVTEFLDQEALLGSVQIASILFAEVVRKDDEERVLAGRVNPYDVRNRPNPERTQLLAKGYHGFNAADSAVATKQNKLSILILEKVLLESIEKEKSERDRYIKEIREVLSWPASEFAITKTLLYISDLRKNHPEKYQAFLQAWEASAPTAAAIALKLRAHPSETKSKGSEFLKIAATGVAVGAAVGAAGINLPADGVVLLGSFSLLGTLITLEHVAPFKYMETKIKGLSALVKRALVKRQAKNIAQQKLSLSDEEANKLIDSGDAKALSGVQAIEHLDLTQLIQENEAHQISDLELRPERLQLRQMRIMSDLSGELALLSERGAALREELETLLKKQKTLDNLDTKSKRDMLTQLNQLQKLSFDLKLDTQNLASLLQRYQPQSRELIAAVEAKKVQDDSSQKLAEQLRAQMAILQGVQQSLNVISQRCDERIEGIINVSLALAANHVTNSVRAQ